MHKTLRALCGVLALASAGAATADIAGNVSLTTDYRFRGISQTDRDPAIQGGFDLATESGFYVGAWASNIQFGGSIEIDGYGGFKGSIGEGLTYDLGYIYYAYPSANEDSAELDDLDYQEFKAALGFLGFTVGVNYSPEYTLETGGFWYVFADYGFALGDFGTLSLHAALNQWEDEEDYAKFGLGDADNILDPEDDAYIDFFVKLAKDMWGVTWAIAYVGTDLDEDDCFDSKICDPMAVVSVTKAL